MYNSFFIINLDFFSIVFLFFVKIWFPVVYFDWIIIYEISLLHKCIRQPCNYVITQLMALHNCHLYTVEALYSRFT